MDWSDDAVVLSVRPLGESGAIVEALTRAHGRHLGLVRGGASRRMKPVLQPGNTLHLHWRARLSEHLGSFQPELARARAGALMDGREPLIGLNAFTAMTSAAMPEREAHENVFEAGEILLGPLRESMSRRAIHAGEVLPPVVASELDEMVVVRGAAAAVLRDADRFPLPT